MNSIIELFEPPGIIHSTAPIRAILLRNLAAFYTYNYYNIDQAAGDEKDFDRQLITMKKELESGNRNSEHQKLYEKYFTVNPMST
ncbi:MAG: hypothetical protein Q7J09_01225 [Methanocalculus sp.]|uniref:hypothetical protein n=1 Tax=Methanocalculus sp. TaxID=2004547 RepID=UPI0027196472|nr:hypothetical protein [Methanocalculus sp.]MDO9538614.1 hypothetical protein [Methanocalculus sp.]